MRFLVFGCIFITVSGPGLAARAQAPLVATDPKVDAILDRLEQRGQSVEDLSCELVWSINDRRTFENSKKEGRLLFRRDEPNAKFLVSFEKLTEDGKTRLRREWHLFDGRFYRQARESTKTVIHREIVREGEKIDPFKLGSGPFPLPFGQKKADILAHFTVVLVPPGKNDPPESDHLECTPRPESTLADDYRKLHFHIDRRLELPVRVVVLNKKDRKTITVDFKNTKLDPATALSRFKLPDETKRYKQTYEPLPPPTAARTP